jgi:hypothetical protein
VGLVAVPTDRRCAYCGGACYGITCSSCADLRRLERAAVTIPKPRAKRAPQFKATCPKCGTQGRGLRCPDCRTLMYLPKSDPMYAAPTMSDELRDAVREAKR